MPFRAEKPFRLHLLPTGAVRVHPTTTALRCSGARHLPGRAATYLCPQRCLRRCLCRRYQYRRRRPSAPSRLRQPLPAPPSSSLRAGRSSSASSSTSRSRLPRSSSPGRGARGRGGPRPQTPTCPPLTPRCPGLSRGSTGGPSKRLPGDQPPLFASPWVPRPVVPALDGPALTSCVMVASHCPAPQSRAGFALGGTVNAVSRFDRKHYVYADLPHGRVPCWARSRAREYKRGGCTS